MSFRQACLRAAPFRPPVSSVQNPVALALPAAREWYQAFNIATENEKARLPPLRKQDCQVPKKEGESALDATETAAGHGFPPLEL